MAAEIKFKSTDLLVPYARNARTHSDSQISQIAASIREFGFTNPVLTDGENGIIAGHGRVMAARKLGIDVVPCIELSHLTEAQKRAYVIADNKLSLNAGWDEELLKLELSDLEMSGFDLDLTGFSLDEIASLDGSSNKDEDSRDASEVDASNKFLLMIEFDSESALSRAYDEATGKGLRCKLIQ